MWDDIMGTQVTNLLEIIILQAIAFRAREMWFVGT